MKKTNIVQYIGTSLKSNAFFICSASFALLLFCFQYWLYWPGFIQDDSQTTLLLDKSGWHPAIMSYLMQAMYFLFGIHVYHLFLLTLIPFYFAILITVNTAYIKTKSWWSFCLFFPCFIFNIFYPEIRLGSSSFSNSWILLLYALTLFFSVTDINHSKIKKTAFFIPYIVVFIISLLSRHNALISVWPITFFWIGLYLKNKVIGFWQYIGRFTLYALTSLVFCFLFLVTVTKSITKPHPDNIEPQTHIILHQIVGACAPELDETCFDDTWWAPQWFESDRMEKLKIKYEKNNLNAEAFTFRHYIAPCFNADQKIDNLYTKWIYAIKNHPKNYFIHQMRYYKTLWFLTADIIPRINIMETYSAARMLLHLSLWYPDSFHSQEEETFHQLAEKIPDDERKIRWSEFENHLDTLIRKNYPAFNVFFFVMVNFILFFLSFYLFIRDRKNSLFLLLFSTSCAGTLNNIIIPLITPVIYSRYMEPVIICATFNLQLFIIVLLSTLHTFETLKQKEKTISKSIDKKLILLLKCTATALIILLFSTYSTYNHGIEIKAQNILKEANKKALDTTTTDNNSPSLTADENILEYITIYKKENSVSNQSEIMLDFIDEDVCQYMVKMIEKDKIISKFSPCHPLPMALTYSID